jgi:hypothetical protein
MCPWHFALPARLCAGSALGVRGVFASLSTKGVCFPKSDARSRRHSKGPATAGQYNGQNLRKLRKLSSIAPTKLPQLGGFFIPAFQLEHHPFNVLVILVPPQEL